MSSIALLPTAASFAISAPLGAACAITAVALAILNWFRCPDLDIINLCSFGFIFVNPAISLLMQIVILTAPPPTLFIRNYTTPEEVQAQIDQLSWRQKNALTSVVIERSNDLRTIPQDLFKSCSRLKNVYFHSCLSLRSIPEDLFKGCSALKEVKFSSCEVLEFIPDDLFKSCPLLEKVSFYGCRSIPSIPEDLFKGCSALKEVDFSSCEVLEFIPDDLFKSCPLLEKVSFYSCRRIPSIPEDLFKGCSALKEVKFSSCEVLEFIPDDLFKSCPLLEKVSFQYFKRVPSIRKDLFKGCSALKEVDFSSCDALESIHEDAFKKCPLLEKVSFYGCRSIPSIPEDLFKGCSALKEVKFSSCEVLEFIPDDLFKSCPLLEKVSFQYCKRVPSIRKDLFKGCSALKEVDFSSCDALESIHEDAFKKCPLLRRVDFGHCEVLESIPDNLFKHKAWLEKANFRFCDRLTGLPPSTLCLPSSCTLDISGCNGLSETVLRRLREATNAEGYSGPRISFSVSERGISTTKTLEDCLRLIRTASGQAITTETLVKSSDQNVERLRLWLNRIGECAGTKKEANRPYYQAIAQIVSLANSDAQFRENTFWPILEEATATCGDRIALSVLQLNIQEQIIKFDKTDLTGFADLLCRGVWAMSLLEEIAREKVKTLRFFDEIETYLGYPIKLKEALNLPICLDGMLYFSCSSLTESDLKDAQGTVEQLLASDVERARFLITQDRWIEALKASRWSRELQAIRDDYAELEDTGAYESSLQELTLQALTPHETKDPKAPTWANPIAALMSGG